MTVASTDVTLTGTLTDPQGNSVNGTLTFTLQGYGATVPLIAGKQALPGLTFTATVSAGTFSVNFYSNQIITPGPLVTFYSISFAPSATTTTVLAFSENFQFSPGTFDFSQLVPLTNVIANTSLPNTVTPHTFAAVSGQFLTGFGSTGVFTSGPSNLITFIPSGSTNPDTGISRNAAGVVGFGNGSSAADLSGSWKATNGTLSGTLISVNGITTSGNGISLSVGTNLPNGTAQAAAIGSTTILTAPGTASNFSAYRLFVYVALTQQATVSETIGPFVVAYNDSTGSRNINIGIGAVSPSSGVGSSTAITSNTLGTYFAGILPLVAQGGTNINVSMAYTSSGATPAQYMIQTKLDTF